MPVQIATATDHVDLFDRLIAFLTTGSTAGGPDWQLLRMGTTPGASALLVAPGLSDIEEIHVGISWHQDVLADAYSLGFWMFRAYNDALPDLAQPGTSAVYYFPIWNTTMPYWFIANGQRLIIATKVSTVYPAGYVGKFLPYGTPGEYPQPYYLGMVTPASTTRWSTINEAHRNFYDPGIAAVMLNPNGQWRAVFSWRDVSGGESSNSGSNYIWPYNSGNIGGSVADDRYRQWRENVDASYPLIPLILHGADPAEDIYGELQGAFAVSGFNSAVENIVEIGVDDYLVMQNMHRTARFYYAALKLE